MHGSPRPLPLIEDFGSHPDFGSFAHERRKSALTLTLIFWGVNYVLLTLGTALAGNPVIAEIAPIRFVTFTLGLLVCLAIHKLLTRLPTIRKRMIALAILAPIAAESFAWVVYFAEITVDPVLRASPITWAGSLRTIAFWTWFFLAWAGMYLAMSYSYDIREEQARTAKIRELAHAAQLRALHSQINPHFLFNSLNSVSALILDGKKSKAEEMVGKLARFLRLGLATDPLAKSTLSAEMELQRSYLEIEQLRFQDLVVAIDVPAELDEAVVPSLILQPLVENAVKYGVSGAPPPASIEIAGHREGDQLVLTVADSGKGKPKRGGGSGIGLKNVRERLTLLYGANNSSLNAQRKGDGRFVAAVRLPLEFG